MMKIADNFCGYLKVGNDICAYNVSDNIVTLLPAESEKHKRYEVFDRIHSRNTDLSEYLYGEDDDGMIAILRNGRFSANVLGFSASIRFATPIIIKACGNSHVFFNMMTEQWDWFHAITFYGGNINALCNPQMAVEEPNDEYLNNNGAREIKIRPWDDYTRTVDVVIDGQKAVLTISVIQTGGNNNEEYKGAYNLGMLNSFIRLSFENAQHFDKIEKYYVVMNKFISLLSLQNNVSFETYLSQRNSCKQYFKTGICRIYDHYENYSIRKCHNVVSLYRILDYVPDLIEAIANDEVDSLLEILPEDNRRIGKISITNIQDLCTALEVAYKWGKRKRGKDSLIEELKKEIKKTIAAFTENHAEIDVNKETTIKSAFDYLDYTLKQRILTLYDENHYIIDKITAIRSLPQVNEANVAAFVQLRNNKTHSGTIEWGDSANMYIALLALEYTCLFRHIDMPDELIESTLLKIF